MLRATTQIVAIFCLLGGTFCLVTEKEVMSINLTPEATSIVECFIKAVDIPWQFSDVELPRVLFFEHATSHLCDRNVWRVFECNYPLMNYLQQAMNLQIRSVEEEYEYYDAQDFGRLESALELQRQALHILEKLILLILKIELVADLRNETRIMQDNCSMLLLEMHNLKNISTELNVEYVQLQARLIIIRNTSDTLWYILPPFIIIVFICGMFGNGILLLIFIRHPETRAGPNALLLNLAISDTLFLFGNVALDYCKKLWGFPLGTTACYIYTFFLTLITGGSVYSMTMLSLCRYLAVRAKPGEKLNVFCRSTPVMLASVWILSSIVAIPDTLRTVTSEGVGNCAADNHLLNALCDFFFISVLPLVSITYFYIAASRRLIDCARNMPGEAVGQIKVKTARERGAKILPALAFVFAITYLPFYTLWAVITVFKINTNESPISHRLFHTGYFLFNLNSTLNPVALYLASSMFRKYFNMYMCLGLVKKRVPTNTQNKTQVVTSRV